MKFPFLEKIRKNVINLLPAKFAKRVSDKVKPNIKVFLLASCFALIHFSLDIKATVLLFVFCFIFPKLKESKGPCLGR